MDSKKKLNIIVFNAHPDDCELQAGGVATLWAAQGHRVKFVNTTNGDIGHWRESGPALAARRKQEVERAAQLLGITTEIMDIHDGELMPTLENRKQVIRLIREWQADIVISPRPNDYHPDHRYTGVLVQDAAFMVTVPFMCPEVPFLKTNPVFLFNTDRFQKPHPSQPDIAISIDSVIEKKLDALLLLESQFLEGGSLGSPEWMPRDAADREVKMKAARERLAKRWFDLANRFRAELVRWHGPERGNRVVYAEAFEICEYGRQPDAEELKRLFPFFD